MTNKAQKIEINIPEPVFNIIEKLNEAGFEAYVVGGCVRDLILNREINDWDITTSAKPKEIQKLFKKSIYENNFGTVGIITGSKVFNLKIIEVTTFRLESNYMDKRHPENIKFADNLKDDLMRRDFTINALALKILKGIKNKEEIKADCEIIDLYEGADDLKNKSIRAVRNANERFDEDALRMMRCVRFMAQLDFKIEKETLSALHTKANNIKYISSERIRDELIKTIMSKNGLRGLLELEKVGLLKIIIPELIQTIGITQNLHHIYTVWEHLYRAMDYAIQENYSLEIRLAALFHDIGKPKVKVGEGKNSTFYNHEMESTKITKKIMGRLKFPSYISDKVVLLVRYHQFAYDPEINTDASLRRLLVKVGAENIDDLAKLREADRVGSGCPKAQPFRLRHFLFRIEKVLKEFNGENISLKTLKIDGNVLIKELKIKPSPKIGFILNVLLEEIIDDPKLNTEEYLLKEAKSLNEKKEKELIELSKKAKQKYSELMDEEEKEIKKKYYV